MGAKEKILIWKDNSMISKEKMHEFIIRILGMYLLLLPVDAALGGIIGNISLINYVSIVYIFLRIIYICIYEKKIDLSKIKQNKLSAMYFIYSIFSIIWARNALNSWYIISMTVAFIMMFFASTDQYIKEDRIVLKKCIFLSAIITIFLCLFMIDWGAENGRLTLNKKRPMDPNFFSIGLCVVTSVIFENIIKRRRIFLSIVVFLMVIILIMLTGSRTGLIVNFITIGLVFLTSNIRTKRKIAIICIALALIIIIGTIVIKINPNSILSRFSLKFTLNDNGAGRFAIWKKAFSVFRENNIFETFFGTGFSTFQKVVDYKNKVAHNTYIQILIEGGIIGISIFILFILKNFSLAKKNKDFISLSAFTAIIIGGIGMDINIMRVFWMLIFFINRAILLEKQE